jgi:hypothetical protein
MLHYMARGPSGRIVIEVAPEEKDQLYTALKKDGMTLKEWFSKASVEYLQGRLQLPLFAEAAPAAELKVIQSTKRKNKKRVRS